MLRSDHDFVGSKIVEGSPNLVKIVPMVLQTWVYLIQKVPKPVGPARQTFNTFAIQSIHGSMLLVGKGSKVFRQPRCLV